MLHADRGMPLGFGNRERLLDRSVQVVLDFQERGVELRQLGEAEGLAMLGLGQREVGVAHRRTVFRRFGL